MRSTPLRSAAARLGRTVHPDATPEKGSFYRSDQFSFARIGVPAFYLDPGSEFVGGLGEGLFFGVLFLLGSLSLAYLVAARLLNVEIDPQGAREIARRSRGTNHFMVAGYNRICLLVIRVHDQPKRYGKFRNT